MSDIQIIVLCVVTAGAAGALVGMLVASTLAATIVKHWLPELPEFIVLKSLTLKTTITDEDDGLSVHSGATWSASGVTGQFVEQWLERRNLVMSPKGKDFTVGTKSKKGGA
ncbi:hypothetical protein [Hydrogenophaga sp.]|uniref:hypothetical protein n=1 Tax=Hydrogenophaga sp. TaxID=1904254 RepID=UPI00273755A0|nr:hypothetical protein [Hydrogenophaga sp.]MDP3887057.1 hypothetical protein [Hydrogenophaga sp.]